MRLNKPDARRVVTSRYVQQRELGLDFPLGFQDKLHHKIYSSLRTYESWDHTKSCNKSGNLVHGGVFNLEYSPDGSVDFSRDSIVLVN